MKNIIFFVVFIFGSTTNLCLGTSLKPISQSAYNIDILNEIIQISALSIGNDTLISGSVDGIYAKFSAKDTLNRILNCIEAKDKSWGEYCHKREKWKNLYYPNIMTFLEKSNELIIFDNLCHCFYKYKLLDNNKYFTELLRANRDDSFINAYYSDNKFFAGMFSTDDIKLAIINLQDNKYKRIFSIQNKLDNFLDSNWISEPIVFPIYSPLDNSIRIAVSGYNYIYKIDTNGVLLDSIHINKSDYFTPRPPISRLRTQAVWRNWLSNWTPITSFNYISSGYFILQYRIGYEVIGNETIPLYSTLVWGQNKQQIELQIDKHWQVAGVQPDGRTIFAHYLIEDNKRQIVLNITRIVP